MCACVHDSECASECVSVQVSVVCESGRAHECLHEWICV
jgi:hypothetical protein